ncbi:MAG: hypothetical protein ACYC5K_01570 [Saccharofermentanales bacterium]
MKRTLLLMAISLLLVFSVSATISAAGVPAAHELPGREFGQAVKELASSEPGAVAEHVTTIHEEINEEEPPIEEPPIEEPPVEEPPVEEPHGMPALHGLTGREFGKAVSELARSEPGAVAAHIRALREETEEEPDPEVLTEEEPPVVVRGMPALHDLSGRAFGQAVSILARSAHGAVAEHVK